MMTAGVRVRGKGHSRGSGHATPTARDIPTASATPATRVAGGKGHSHGMCHANDMGHIGGRGTAMRVRRLEAHALCVEVRFCDEKHHGLARR
jgi:hypothetical protein